MGRLHRQKLHSMDMSTLTRCRKHGDTDQQAAVEVTTVGLHNTEVLMILHSKMTLWTDAVCSVPVSSTEGDHHLPLAVTTRSKKTIL
jgi:hypothetical protein